MDQEMRVVKHQTIEKNGETPHYRVHLKADIQIQKHAIPTATILSDDDGLFDDFPLAEIVNLKISKPQQKLVKNP